MSPLVTAIPNISSLEVGSVSPTTHAHTMAAWFSMPSAHDSLDSPWLGEELGPSVMSSQLSVSLRAQHLGIRPISSFVLGVGQGWG